MTPQDRIDKAADTIAAEPLALLWAKRQVQIAEQAALHKLVIELREQQAELRPLIDQFNARRKANMRQDGPQGFVMVVK